MASVDTFTKTGNKSTATELNPNVFDVKAESHELIKQAYVAHQANARDNISNTLTRGEVRGGGKKPWRQKGTGRARHGSIRSPIWRTGGITFGPSKHTNFSKQLNRRSKRLAIKQALSLATERGAVKVIETFECREGKTKQTADLLKKIEAKDRVLIVVSLKDELVVRATRNLENVKATQAKYLNVVDLLNADTILISKKSLDIINEWLDEKGTKQ